jgi:hypothetical protein
MGERGWEKEEKGWGERRSKTKEKMRKQKKLELLLKK